MPTCIAAYRTTLDPTSVPEAKSLSGCAALRSRWFAWWRWRQIHGGAIVAMEATSPPPPPFSKPSAGAGLAEGFVSHSHEFKDATTQEGDGSPVPFAPYFRWPG
jgi:hypothetical protein